MQWVHALDAGEVRDKARRIRPDACRNHKEVRAFTGLPGDSQAIDGQQEWYCRHPLAGRSHGTSNCAVMVTVALTLTLPGWIGVVAAVAATPATGTGV